MEGRMPVQCSEDLPPGSGEGSQALFQTAMEVPGSASTSLSSGSVPVQTNVPRSSAPPQTSRVTAPPRGSGDPSGQHLETDAEVIAATGASSVTLTGRGDPSAQRDRIDIQGSGCKIQAVGLAAALKPGGVFQLGVNNQMTVVQNKGGDASTVQYSVKKAKHPLTRSQAEPQYEQLDLVSSKIAGDWRRLGRVMGLDDSTLDQLKIDYNIEGQHEVNYRMLQKWRQRCATGQFTLAALAQLLVKAGRGDIADEFRNC